jgi:hypothetical protein
MDADRFEALLRSFTTSPSRRGALRVLLGSALAGSFGWLGSAESRGDKKRGKGKGKGKKKKNRRCPEDSVTCGGGTCAGPGQCCPDEKRCGGGCIAGTSCCPYFERECPGGGCVPLVNGCCAEAECGECGTCLNGRCVELPGLCDEANCEICNTFNWTCQVTCGGSLTCCGGQCCATGHCEDCIGGTTCTYRCGNNCCFNNQCLDEPCGG